MSTCLHCGPTPYQLQGRGLCARCYNTKGIRKLYPRKKGNHRPNGFGEEPTMEQVEALVAEQMLCLPDWWDEDARKETGVTDEERGWVVPVVRMRLARKPGVDGRRDQ